MVLKDLEDSQDSQDLPESLDLPDHLDKEVNPGSGESQEPQAVQVREEKLDCQDLQGSVEK